MDERAQIHLLHMRDAAVAALSFVKNRSEADFLQDVKTQYAVSLSLIMLGENAVKLPDGHPDVLLMLPDVEWQQIRGMRNRLVPAYVDVDLHIVWSTVTIVLPKLVEKIEELLA
jgi:uncharacterized protein with HEPN domain